MSTARAAGAGGVIGAALAARQRSPWARAVLTLAGFTAACVALAAAGAAPTFWVYLGISVFVAGSATAGNAACGALLISRTVDASRGAVAATLNGMARTCSIVALALGGLLGTFLSPRMVFVLCGVAGAAVIIVIASVSLRTIRRTLTATVPVASNTL